MNRLNTIMNCYCGGKRKMTLIEKCDVCGKEIKDNGLIGFFNSFSITFYTPFKQNKTLCKKCSDRFLAFIGREAYKDE